MSFWRHSVLALGFVLACGARSTLDELARDDATGGATGGSSVAGASGTFAASGTRNAGSGGRAGSDGRAGASDNSSSGAAGISGAAGSGGILGGAGGVIDAGLFDASDDAANDASQACDLGVNDHSDSVVMGVIAYFAGGASLPRGRYRISYVDGCMKYSTTGQGWTVNAYSDASDGFWLVGASTVSRYQIPPGTVGYLAGAGAYDTFDECVAANSTDPPLEIEFSGGLLGVWLQDGPYTDNVPGPDGRNPTWRLTYLDGACP